MLGRFDKFTTVDIHLGHTIVDALAKPMLGLLVLAISIEKTKFDKPLNYLDNFWK